MSIRFAIDLFSGEPAAWLTLAVLIIVLTPVTFLRMKRFE